MVQKSSPKQDFFSQESTTHALAYIPYFIGPVLMFALATSDKRRLSVHIKYSAVIALIAILLMIMMNSFFTWIVSLGYIALSIMLAVKAYNGETIQIDFIDTLEDRVQEKIKK